LRKQRKGVSGWAGTTTQANGHQAAPLVGPHCPKPHYA
jgi:hypothetical protein